MTDARSAETTIAFQSQGESVKPRFRFPRRLFLKSLGSLMLVRAADRAIRYMNVEAEQRSDVPVYWRFGNDVLEEKDGVYLRDHPSVILGETAVWQLDSVLSGASIIEQNQKDRISSLVQGPLEGLRAAGSGSDDFYRTLHSVLVGVRDHGSSVVATDGNFYTSISRETFDQELGPLNRAKTIMLCGLLGIGSGTLLTLNKEIERMEEAKKNGLPYKPSLAARVVNEMFLVYGLGLGDQAVRMVTPNRLQPGVSLSAEMLGSVMDELSSVLSEKGDILIDAINRSANASMALNARIVQEVLRQNPSLTQKLLPKESSIPLEMYLFAGGAHGDVKDLYFSRVEYVSAKLENIADRLIDFHIQGLRTAKDQGNNPQAVYDSWIVATSRFGYPIPSFARSESFQSAPKLDLPDSPRAILYKQLFKRIVRQGDDKGTTTREHKLLLQRLFHEDNRFNAVYEQHVAPLRERAMVHRDQAELIVPVYNDLDLVFFEGIPHWLPNSPGSS